MPAISLNEAAKIAARNGEMKKAGIIATYAEKSDLLNAMLVEGIDGNALTYNQEGEVPTTAFRGINEAYTANAGTFNPETEALYIAGGDLDVDGFIVQTQGQEVRSRHEAFKVKALAIGITTALVNGSNASNRASFDGFATRITESTQLIDAGTTANGAALTLSKLDRLIAQVDSPTHLLMSPLMLLKFQKAARSSSFPNIVMDKDDMGNQFTRYGNLRILTGYPLGGKNTALLPFEEASYSGTATSSSIYALNLSEDGCVLISNGGISVRDKGEINDAPVWRTRVEWFVGMVNYSAYARARLRYIGDLDITN